MKNITYRRNGRLLLDFSPAVFFTSVLIILAFVIASFVYLRQLDAFFSDAQAWIANKTGWVLVLMTNIVLGYMVYLMFSRFARVRLGGADARPDFTYAGWFAMLFGAGMGIGLLFYSVAEPLYHLVTPPHGAEPMTEAAARDAMKTTFLHWGFHAWGIYALVALALAYFSFNRNKPLSLRSVFQPLLGDRIYGVWGHAIDILATVATLFGVATSLGLGVSQVNAGLNHLLGLPDTQLVKIALIAVITFVATLSVVAGLDKGIKRLSQFNMVCAAVLLLFVLAVGPTLFILNALVENIGLYLDDFFFLGFWNETYTRGSWQNGWTVFYWGWWTAWSPFVGMFIARISYGRTIREFIGGVLLVPTLITFFWLSVFGDSALFIDLFAGGDIAQVAQDNVARSLFVFFDQLPSATGTALPQLLITCASLLATLVVVTFFVTSSDSGSLVIDIITAGGKPNPPVTQRVFWASTEGVVAAALLVGGGLTALQTAAIASGLPFALVLLVMQYSLYRGLAIDHD